MFVDINTLIFHNVWIGFCYYKDHELKVSQHCSYKKYHIDSSHALTKTTNMCYHH